MRGAQKKARERARSGLCSAPYETYHTHGVKKDVTVGGLAQGGGEGVVDSV